MERDPCHLQRFPEPLLLSSSLGSQEINESQCFKVLAVSQAPSVHPGVLAAFLRRECLCPISL